jgi:hypothetical protein
MSVSEPLSKIVFGIYPGGSAGSDNGLAAGKPDDLDKINSALDHLQGHGRQLLVRAYTPFVAHDCKPGVQATPSSAKRYSHYGINRRKLDLVLTFGDKQGDIERWTQFVRDVIHMNAGHLGKVQITEEPNLVHPPGDGVFPRIAEAVVEGVIAAKEEVQRLGFDTLVGFNAVQAYKAYDPFWEQLDACASKNFRQSLDYVGVDLFPDVFKPLSDVTMGDAVLSGISSFRHQLEAIKLAESLPIHITEHGWPTSLERSYHRQAEVLDETVRTIVKYQREFHVSHYELFSLRDADSYNPGIFFQFGLLRDDYSPKPAFEVFRQLISEFGV